MLDIATSFDNQKHDNVGKFAFQDMQKWQRLTFRVMPFIMTSVNTGKVKNRAVIR